MLFPFMHIFLFLKFGDSIRQTTRNGKGSVSSVCLCSDSVTNMNNMTIN
jgi:hypothetical protein